MILGRKVLEFINFKFKEVLIMNKTEKFFMNVEEVAEIMGISRSLAYVYVQKRDCPFKVVKINGRYTIATNSFYKWYDSLAEMTEC